MKLSSTHVGRLAILLLAPVAAFAQLTVPSDGSDGDLIISQNTVTDLRLASDGQWDQANTGNRGNGVYDHNKWAVVFKFKSVTIAAGATNTFINNSTHAPVVWLVQGDVRINGALSLDGSWASSSVPDVYLPTEPGPGGFRGGAGSPLGRGTGYGPGFSASADFGNPQIVPLIGGGGGGATSAYSGSAGGGAILIVAAGNVIINGRMSAQGGPGFQFGPNGGSSGCIRVVANTVSGNGYLDTSTVYGGATGRTRIECNSLAPTLNIFPNASAVPPGQTPIIWPSDSAPTVRVMSVDGHASPADPAAAVAGSADVPIQNNGPVDILLETRNLPTNGVVSLRLNPKYSAASWLNATYLSGDITTASWKVTTTPPVGFFTVQARATAP
jgi:hypothetical protein